MDVATPRHIATGAPTPDCPALPESRQVLRNHQRLQLILRLGCVDVDRIVSCQAAGAEPAVWKIDRFEQTWQGKIGDAVRTDVAANFFHRHISGDQFVPLCKIDSQIAGPHDRRGMHAHVDFFRASLSKQLHDGTARCATDDRVVDQDDALSFKYFRQRVELERNTDLTKPLVWLDKGPSDIAILHQRFRVGQPAFLGIADSSRNRRIWETDDDISIDGLFLRELYTHTLANEMNALVRDQTVRAGKIDELQQAHRRPGRKTD